MGGLGLQLLPHGGLVDEVRHGRASQRVLAQLLRSHGLRPGRTLSTHQDHHKWGPGSRVQGLGFGVQGSLTL